MRRSYWQNARAAIVSAALLGLVGCGGPGRGNAVGKVTYGSRALAYGSVLFIGPDGIAVTAPIGTDGTYTATNVMEGENKVAVYSINPSLAVPQDRDGRPRGKPEVDPKLWFPIPDKYYDAQTSQLVYDIKPNTTNSIDIELR